MERFRTHYDNLQVARNATAEVISAAYRSLSFKYHPDRNNGDGRAERIMRILNRSFAVLSDPSARSEHDRWIAQMEASAAAAARESAQQKSDPLDEASQNRPDENLQRKALFQQLGNFLKRWGLLTAIVAIVALGILMPPTPPKPSGLPPYDQTVETGRDETASDSTSSSWTLEPLPNEAGPESGASQSTVDSQAAYVRPATAPNGSAWPTSAGYVSGYPRLGAGGLSTVTVDNSSNESDVFVKLVEINSSSTRPVRQFFIPANGQFAVRGVRAGEYDVRYKDLSDGALARSESFELKEIQEQDGIRFSNITMTLYKVTNGNMQTFPLAEAEF